MQPDIVENLKSIIRKQNKIDFPIKHSITRKKDKHDSTLLRAKKTMESTKSLLKTDLDKHD
jgi:hypothetical protein